MESTPVGSGSPSFGLKKQNKDISLTLKYAYRISVDRIINFVVKTISCFFIFMACKSYETDFHHVYLLL